MELRSWKEYGPWGSNWIITVSMEVRVWPVATANFKFIYLYTKKNEKSYKYELCTSAFSGKVSLNRHVFKQVKRSTEEETELCNQMIRNYNNCKGVPRNKIPNIHEGNINKLQKEKRKANTVLSKLIHPQVTLTYIDDFIYAVAITIDNNNCSQRFLQSKQYKNSEKIPPWWRKLLNKIRRLQFNIFRI